MKGSHRTSQKGGVSKWGKKSDRTNLGATGERMRGRVRHVVGVEVDGVKRQPRVGLVLIVFRQRARTVCALCAQASVNGHREVE